MFVKYRIKIFSERNDHLTPRSYDTEWKTRIHEHDVEHQKRINEKMMLDNYELQGNTFFCILVPFTSFFDILITERIRMSIITFCCKIIVLRTIYLKWHTTEFLPMNNIDKWFMCFFFVSTCRAFENTETIERYVDFGKRFTKRIATDFRTQNQTIRRYNIKL